MHFISLKFSNMFTWCFLNDAPQVLDGPGVVRFGSLIVNFDYFRYICLNEFHKGTGLQGIGDVSSRKI